MLYLLPGLAAFLLFYLYEVGLATGRFSGLKLPFFLGVLLIFCSTGAAAVSALEGPIVIWRVAVFGAAALLFLALMLYSLFGAVPFSKTYLEAGEQAPPSVCRTGMYALCRHPGVLWFIGFYLSLWLALGGVPLLSQLVFFSSLNLIYILIQDNWSFLICFEDYADYKKSVPFLIPNRRSFRRCLESSRLPRGGHGT